MKYARVVINVMLNAKKKEKDKEKKKKKADIYYD